MGEDFCRENLQIATKPSNPRKFSTVRHRKAPPLVEAHHYSMSYLVVHLTYTRRKVSLQDATYVCHLLVGILHAVTLKPNKQHIVLLIQTHWDRRVFGCLDVWMNETWATKRIIFH